MKALLGLVCEGEVDGYNITLLDEVIHLSKGAVQLLLLVLIQLIVVKIQHLLAAEALQHISSAVSHRDIHAIYDKAPFLPLVQLVVLQTQHLLARHALQHGEWASCICYLVRFSHDSPCVWAHPAYWSHNILHDFLAVKALQHNQWLSSPFTCYLVRLVYHAPLLCPPPLAVISYNTCGQRRVAHVQRSQQQPAASAVEAMLTTDTMYILSQ